MNIICPGWVVSKNDGDRHWIGYWQLIKLYGLDHRNCIHEKYATRRELRENPQFHPRYDGKYE